ncbi:MAG: exo-alpha-sialidase [Microbacterium sp.]|uniref:sialidase family protein n=1 Tax=Microbacterium sp. TaxID=51671 RepID=UPI001DB82E0D|nr:sialidase family protein [Microbacterium sp.]MBW8764555.1 exo-alpha-sialidase [Microbacterium sp.]
MPIPLIDRGAAEALRDPALVFHAGRCHLFCTTVRPAGHAFSLGIDLLVSDDLRQWSTRTIFAPGPDNWSSPGSIVRAGDAWVMCLQSYPIDPGATWGNESARLWLATSSDLVTWSAPRPISPAGCRVAWTASARQIDPYLIAHAGRWWCLYKAAGQLGLLVSDDLITWSEASPQRPILGTADTPDGSTVENPCVIATDDGFVLFFSPCRPGRGIGVARSTDLLSWHDAHYIDFPDVPWAPGGPTAAMVVDRRREDGDWLMAFHGDRPTAANEHGAAIAFARSRDLEHWTV